MTQLLEAPKTSPAEVTRLESFLRAKNLKLTGERRIILDAIFRHESHFDAETLHADLKEAGSDVSRATVYRTLDLMVQAGLVRKNSLGSSHANYEAARNDDHHDHLICLGCNHVIEFFQPALEAMQEQVCQSHHFQLVHHSLQIFGLCPNCQGKADESVIRNRVAQLHT
ncbi:MAG: transcriptional repressor [Firmicutes bacterium]|nr:transcriptional repressor [Bacillota bacterium]